MPRTLVCLHEGLLRVPTSFISSLQPYGAAVPSSLTSVILEFFDEFEYLLDFLSNGIFFQVFEPSCQQLNVQADENVYKADFGHL